MPKHGKKYTDAAKKIDFTAQYEIKDALELIKQNASAKFTRQ